MTDEELLRLVVLDSSSDYREDVGEYGGYLRFSVEDGVLTVEAKACPEDEDGELVVTRRAWKLTPAEAIP
jgi:hypothetical protein